MARGFRLPLTRKGRNQDDIAAIDRERSERDAARLERLLGGSASTGDETLDTEPYRGPERRAAIRTGPRRS